MRFLFHSLLGLFLMASSVGITAYAGYWVFAAVQSQLSSEPTMPPRKERVFAVKVMRAEPGAQDAEILAFGEIRSRRTLDIRTRASGSIQKLAENFVDGGRVSAGELLMQIDPADAQAQLDRAQTDLSDAEAALRAARRSFDLAQDELASARNQADLRERAFQRQKDLVKRGVGSTANSETSELAASQARQAVLVARQAADAAETEVDQSTTRLARARIALGDAQRRLDETTLTAPFAGTLGAVKVLEGGVVAVNEQLAQLVDPDALEVAFRMPTREFAYLLDDKGQLRPLSVQVTLSGLEQGITTGGRITRDSGVIAQGETGRLVFAALDQAAGFKPGDFVRVIVNEPPLADVIALPASALGVDGTVLVVGPDERLVALPVDVLRRQGDMILVRAEDGLSGQLVVSERSPLLGPGILVTVEQDSARASVATGQKEAALRPPASRQTGN